MPTLGLVVEGQYDEVALTELIRKCVVGHVEVIVRICRGSIMNKFPGLLEEFRRVRHGTHVDKALVVRDANGKDPDQLIEVMRNRISNRAYPFPVRLVVILRELETRLLADEEGITAVTSTYSGMRVPRVNEALEGILAPKERLMGLLSVRNVPYTAEVARRIAAVLDIEKLRYRCPGFMKFQEAVLDC